MICHSIYKSLILIDKDDALQIGGRNNDGLLKILKEDVRAEDTAIVIYDDHSEVAHFTGETGSTISQRYSEFLAQVPAMNGHVITRDGIVAVTANEGAVVQSYSYYTGDTAEAYDNIAMEYHIGKASILVLNINGDRQRIAADAGCPTADPMDYCGVRRSIIELGSGY